MENLISGWQAIQALEDGKDVEYSSRLSKWYDLNSEKGKWLVADFTRGIYKFRIKPRTISINGIVIPAPFEPKEGEKFYVLQSCNESGWMGDESYYQKEISKKWLQFGAWRTLEEIKQVVDALRSILGAAQ